MSAKDAAAIEPHPITEMTSNTVARLHDAPAPEPGASPDPRHAWDPGRAAREFEAICAKHNLACGAPEDLVPFQRALGENKQLAMNFWSVVARLSDGTRGPGLGEREVLAAVVRAVTGEEIEQARQSQGHAIDRLARLLAGEDVSLDSAPQAHVTGPRQVSAAKLPLARTEGQSAEAPAESVLPSPAGSRSRLVLLPDAPRTLGAAIAAAPKPAENAAQTQFPDAVSRPEPVRLRTETQHHAQDEPRLTIPLSSYRENADRSGTARRAVIVLLALAILCGVGFLIARKGPAWRQAVSARLGSGTAAQPGSAALPAAPATAPGVSTAPAPPAIPSAPVVPTTPAAIPAISSAPANPAIPAAISSTPAVTKPQPTVSLNEESADAADDVHDAALVQVPGEEMRGRLISSRFPIVPDAANADAVSGVVIVQAVITASGTVEHARALSGPESLRQPAVDAVSFWRYRPYLVDGAPVDVRTTIRVDFSGND